MSPSTIYEDELRQLIRKGRSVLVAGTGVSIAASSHPQASWTGLLGSGIEWLESHRLMAADEVEAHRTLLLKPKTRRLISTAQDIVEEMGGDGSKHFADWLERTVGSIRAKDRRVLDALDALRRHGHLLATTNYDGLLLSEPPVLDAITWQETDELVRVVQAWDTDQVIFLHGYWRKPGSVVLDWDSYRRIAEDQQYRQDLRALWTTHTWVYVGCGVDGLSDPDFGLLLERYGRRARRAGHWDYCLVRGEEQRQAFQAHFDMEDFNVRAVSFGEQFDDLPGFLRSLLPEPVAEEPAVGAMAEDVASKPGGRERVIPKPPDFYAEPPYIGSHQFVGRQAELNALNDWANAADPTNLLLFKAIGGTGKSMLTWEWVMRHATVVRPDWAGRFWYSFYERGAIMQDFCQRALAYMTGRPLKEFRRRKTGEMREELVAQLRSRPWLVVLDGLERVLVAYHRIDAAEIPDEEVDDLEDNVLNRNSRDAIRDEDTDLLRSLVGCEPSKIVVSSRLTPRVLLNTSDQPIPKVRRIELLGLRPTDAEALMRSCGVSGDSAEMQDYLQQNCDNHPLVIGILAGLINEPGPSRGDFDAWSRDPQGGARLDLGKLDIRQRHNHILLSAIDALPDAGRQLLSILALLSESVDYETLLALNPHLPPKPEKVPEPIRPERERIWRDRFDRVSWEGMTGEERRDVQEKYEERLELRKTYEMALEAWRDSTDVLMAPKNLAKTVQDLEERGLLQYDNLIRHYDLHPVVRGVAAGGMETKDKERYGQRVVDHFSSQASSHYENAQSLEEVSAGLHVVRTYLTLGQFEKALSAYRGRLSNTLRYNLEAHAETLALLRPFYPNGWNAAPKGIGASSTPYLLTATGNALADCGADSEAVGVHTTGLHMNLEKKRWSSLRINMHNISICLSSMGEVARAFRLDLLELDLASVLSKPYGLFRSYLNLLASQTSLGQMQEAAETWGLLDKLGREWSRLNYRQGFAESRYAWLQFHNGTLEEEHLVAAASLANQDNNRPTIRSLHHLRGRWRLEQGNFLQAIESFQEAVRLARERRLEDAPSETGLVLAKLNLHQLTKSEASLEAERLGRFLRPAYRYLAMLWHAIGDAEKAKLNARAAYRWAWADGEPYVYRVELTKTTDLLEQMGIPIPVLPPYDPAKDEPFPWEEDVKGAIEMLRAEKEAKERKGAERKETEAEDG